MKNILKILKSVKSADQDCGSGLIRSFLVGSWPVSQLLGRWQKNHAAGFAGCIFLLSRLGLCSRIAGTMSFNLELDSIFFILMHPDLKFFLTLEI